MKFIAVSALIILIAGIALLDVVLGALGVSSLAFAGASALAVNLPPEATISPLPASTS